MNWKFEKEFRADHPETIGETDKEFDLDNYREWLEKQLKNCNLDIVSVSVLSVSKKPAAYVEHHLLRAIKNTDHAIKYIKNTKRLTKSEMMQYIRLIKEPFMRAFGYVFPDEIHEQHESRKFYQDFNKTER